MNALLIAAALAATPVQSFAVPDDAAEALARRVQSGTLLMSEGDCLAVKAFTGSPYTHVGGVVVERGRAFVYDSQNGVGVRKLTLREYLAATRPDELHVLNPAEPFDAEKTDEFRSHLESQLGRPYSVTHHLTGRPSEGLHCAEYVTGALMAAGVAKAKRPARVSPASLRKGLLRHGLYVETETVAIVDAESQRKPGESWCEEMWLDTKDCCTSCWTGFRACVLCR